MNTDNKEKLDLFLSAIKDLRKETGCANSGLATLFDLLTEFAEFIHVLSKESRRFSNSLLFLLDFLLAESKRTDDDRSSERMRQVIIRARDIYQKGNI